MKRVIFLKMVLDMIFQLIIIEFKKDHILNIHRYSMVQNDIK